MLKYAIIVCFISILLLLLVLLLLLWCVSSFHSFSSRSYIYIYIYLVSVFLCSVNWFDCEFLYCALNFGSSDRKKKIIHYFESNASRGSQQGNNRGKKTHNTLCNRFSVFALVCCLSTDALVSKSSSHNMCFYCRVKCRCSMTYEQKFRVYCRHLFFFFHSNEFHLSYTVWFSQIIAINIHVWQCSFEFQAEIWKIKCQKHFTYVYIYK